LNLMRRPFALALALHVAVLLLIFVVLPTWPDRQSRLDEPIVVEMVTAPADAGGPDSRRPPQPPSAPDRTDNAPSPVPEVTPIPRRPAAPAPRQTATEAPPSEPAAKQPTPPSPPRTEPMQDSMRVARPKPKAEPLPREAPKAPAVKAAPEGAAPPKTLARIEPKQAAKPEAAPTPKPEAKSPAKPETKPEPKPETKPAPKPEADDFATVGRTVKDLQQKPAATAPAAPAPSKPAPPAEEGDFSTQMSKALRGNAAVAAAGSASPAAPAAGAGNSLPVTAGEIDSVRRQIEQCWSLPANVKPTKDLVVQIRVEMNPDGTPRSAVIQDSGRMSTDSGYRATAESARRAVLNPRCHPFKLPREKYDRWRTLNLVFNPAEMFRT
jgi:TolA protein